MWYCKLLLLLEFWFEIYCHDSCFWLINSIINQILWFTWSMRRISWVHAFLASFSHYSKISAWILSILHLMPINIYQTLILGNSPRHRAVRPLIPDKLMLPRHRISTIVLLWNQRFIQRPSSHSVQTSPIDLQLITINLCYLWFWLMAQLINSIRILLLLDVDILLATLILPLQGRISQSHFLFSLLDGEQHLSILWRKEWTLRCHTVGPPRILLRLPSLFWLWLNRKRWETGVLDLRWLVIYTLSLSWGSGYLCSRWLDWFLFSVERRFAGGLLGWQVRWALLLV